MHQERKPRAISDEHVQLGKAVRGLRRRLDISQEALGHQAGMHRNYVGALERGEVNPTFKTLMIVAAGLGVKVSELVRVYELQRRRLPLDG